MEWRVCPDHPTHEVSERGDVRRCVDSRKYKIGHVLTAKPHQRGYLIYSLNNKDVLAHRLVAAAFLGPAPTARHEVAHEDGSRTNNYWRNLSWKLPADNQADRKRHGTFTQGEQCSSAKLSDAEVAAVRQRYEAGGKRYVGGAVTMEALAREYGVSQAQISRVVNGRQRNGSS